MSRPAAVVLWALQVVLALVFVGSAVGKLTGDPAIVAVFDALGPLAWLRYPVAVAEIVGAVGLLVPATTALAAAALTLLMLGAVSVHLFVAGGSVVPALVVLVLCAVTLVGRRKDLLRPVTAGRTGPAGGDAQSGGPLRR